MTKSTRRRFLQASAVGAALPLAAFAQDVPAAPEDALLSFVRLRFKHLNEVQLKAVMRSLRGDVLAAEIVRRVRLAPTDEPATVFVADVAE